MPALGFLAPLFLLGSLAVAVPLVLHLLRQRADPVQPFSAVSLLQHARVEHARRRRLRDVWLFLLRAAALVLLAVAFARPYLVGAAPLESPVTVLLADVSGSLSDAARTARLRDLAAAAIDRAPASNRVALVQFASDADVLVAPTTDRQAARAAASRLTPGFGATSYRAALAKAADLVKRPGGRVVFVTDLQAGGWNEGPDPVIRPDVPVEVADVGPLPPNLGITAIDRDSAGHVVVRVGGTAPLRPVKVRFDVNAQPRATVPAAFEGAAGGQASAALVVAPGDTVRASIDDPGGLPADDQRWYVESGHARPAVIVVTAQGSGQDEGLYVERALQALDGARAVAVTARGGNRIQTEGVPGGTSVVVLTATTGMDRRGVEGLARYVREGGGLLLAAGPAVTFDLVAAGFGDEMPRLRPRAALAAPYSLVPADVRHPALAVFASHAGAFTEARFTRIAELRAAGSCDVLARFDSGEPALVSGRYGKGRVVVFASDLGNRWNDLALQPAFVPLVGELVAWAGGAVSAPAGIVAGQSPLAGTERPGTVALPATTSRVAARVAVNVDPREFEAARETPTAFLTHVSRADSAGDVQAEGAARRDESSRGLWRYGLGLVLAALLAESVVGRRA